MLATALKEAYFENVALYEVNDDFENTKNKLAEALSENEVVLVSAEYRWAIMILWQEP